MEGHLEYKENRVIISDELRNQQLFKKLYTRDTSQNKKKFYDFITYLYFVYSKKSTYSSFLPSAKHIMACTERLNMTVEEAEKYIQAIEDNELMALIISWYIKAVYNVEERLMLGVLDKIEEYLTFMQDFKPDKTNHESFVKAVKGSNELLDYREKIQQRVFKEIKKTGQSGSKSTFIEDKLNKLNN